MTICVGHLITKILRNGPSAHFPFKCATSGITKWDDHEMVKVILRSLVFRNPTQVQLIRGDPRYKLMSPKEVIGKFVSFELMIKDSKHIVNLEQGATFTPEVQLVAFKATEEKKEESTPSRLPIDASKLDNEEMALIIKSFHQILKQRRGKDYKSHSKKVCYQCENLSNELSICHDSISSLRTENANLISKIEKLNVCNDSISYLRDENAILNAKIKKLNACKPSTSTVDHVSICTRCRDINIEAIDDHLAMIKQQNDHIAKLTTKINEHELENKKFKFARSMFYNGRRPALRMALVSNRGAMSRLMPHGSG
jgi:hypothetical protein